MRVFAENIEFVGKHGVYEDERTDGRLFRVDVEAEIKKWVINDDIAQTLDYRRLVNVVLDVGLGESVQLVETLAYGIIYRIYQKYDEVERVVLTIRKKAPDIAGNPEWVGAKFDVSRRTWDAMHAGG